MKYLNQTIILLKTFFQRVSDALDISLSTVSRIKLRFDRNEALDTPGKFRPRLKEKTENLPENQKMEVRNVIYNMYSDSK